MNRATKLNLAALSLSTALVVGTLGCEEAAPGTLELRIYGEQFIEQGIPASAFSDGWAVSFEHFVLAVAQAGAAQGHGEKALATPGARLFNVAVPTMGQGTVVASGMVNGGTYDHISYTIGPATTTTAAGSGVDTALMTAMASAGESVRVKGTATKAGRTIRFDWGFKDRIEHVCHATTQVDGGSARAELTIHGDHLFYDDLVAEEPNLAFELIAASDTNGDNQVSQAELAAKDITKEARYQVGSFPVKNLAEFIAHQATTLGHINGEGHCETQVQ